ncbi:hypothetical protein COV93_08270 [Candidatus Woesearchaeota archaeon CG11_big_fil_rev_8_21_14_0_20_43_8]|nr:MAG: hypothetical protein COV93_08270 [Candidatus Woesearchaeota archaeon CG11_big_fil_rev_8_21_14_0_20_43_8]PIO04995.1 MAG: hypothetical protein COT47_06680 [Candidatus Woesearchaeota archaeon CG08_land_8_20_14_0_20_43_7]
MTWRTISRPGFFGKRRDEIKSGFDEKYGKDNWRRAYQWGREIIPREMAMQLYEDGYLMHFKRHLSVLEWLISTACDVYDNAESNVHSGLDYAAQENDSCHLQDISIRRCIVRLGRYFEGDHLVEIRSKSSEGAHLSPGKVLFHMQEMIKKPGLESWWNPGMIEDFYQSNKLLQVKR